MVTIEQKRAIQSLLLDELRTQSETAPTLLFDVLMSGQGFAWVHHIVNLQHQRHAQLAQMTAHLMDALRVPAQPAADDEKAA